MVSKKRLVKANWHSSERNRRLIGLIAREMKAKKRGKAIKAERWRRVTAEFNKHETAPYELQQLQNRMQILKRQFKSYDLVTTSGAGNLSDEAWEDFVAAHKDCAEWRDNAFEYYEDMGPVMNDEVAAGFADVSQTVLASPTDSDASSVSLFSGNIVSPFL